MSTTSSSAASPTSTLPSKGSSWDTNKPSQALFYLAIVVGILIALLFIFFSLRYFIRAKLGVMFVNAEENSDLRELSHDLVYQNSFDPQLHLRESGQVGFGRFGIILSNNRNNNHNTNGLTMTRPIKFSKRFRLTSEELNYLFPERSYNDWLSGGAEKDALKRNIHTEIKYDVNNDINNEQDIVEMALETPDIDVVNNEKSIIVNDDNDDVKSLATIKSTISIHQPPKETETLFDSESCAICLEDFESEDVVRGLICGHVFHKTCVDPWLSNRKACCPLCKRDYYLKNRLAENLNSHDQDNESEEGEENNNNSSTTINDDPHRFDLMTEEEVSRLRETERVMAENRRHIAELSLVDRYAWNINSLNNGEENNEILLHNLETYNEYLNSVRPLSIRAHEALEQHPELEALAVARVESKYYNWKYRLFWKFMGISKRDLINSIIVGKYETIRQNESNNNDNNNNNNNSNNSDPNLSTNEHDEDTVVRSASLLNIDINSNPIPTPTTTNRETIDRMV